MLWNKRISLLLVLCMAFSLMVPAFSLAEGSRPVLTVFDFTEELNQELINKAPTILKMEEDLGVDLQIEVDSVPVNEINDAVPSESSAQVAERVRKAREIQLERYRGTGRHCNAQLTNTEVSRYCTPDAEGLRLLNMAVDSMHLSMRAYQRILKVSRTIADLAGEETISSVHIAEAVQYRELDQKYWR